MLSLLPLQEKKKLVKEYHFRFAAVLTVLVSILFLVASIGLLPSYLIKKAESKTLLEQQEQAARNNDEASIVRAEVEAAANKSLAEYLLARVVVLQTKPSTSSIITKIFEKAGPTISIRSVEVGDTQVVINGEASTRSELIEFHQRLRQEPDFKNSVLPISNIAKSTKAVFSIQINLIPTS